MAKSKLPSSAFFLKFSVALFFLALGICGVLPNVEESIFSLNNSNLVVEVIFGIIEIVCALIIFGGLFTQVKKGWMSMASLLICIFWLLRIVYTQFFHKFVITAGTISFYPDIWQWFLNFFLEFVVLAVVWAINRSYSD
jgi:hypothetical protein